MGNCQAAEAATVVIQHPGGDKEVERIYWSVSARHVMDTNPGHYVALVLTSPTTKSDDDDGGGAAVKRLKLLRPNDRLLIGQVYRLICFEDLLKEFAAKKCVKLGKLLERGGVAVEKKMLSGGPILNPNLKPKPDSCRLVRMEQQLQVFRIGGRSRISSSRHRQHGGGGGQWKPALHSIAEVAT